MASVLCDAERQAWGVHPPATPLNREKSFGQAQTILRAECGAGACRRPVGSGLQTRTIFQRPFCLRRFSVARPERVLMRFRNPWARRRLVLETGLRCFFMRGLLYEFGEEKQAQDFA